MNRIVNSFQCGGKYKILAFPEMPGEEYYIDMCEDYIFTDDIKRGESLGMTIAAVLDTNGCDSDKFFKKMDLTRRKLAKPMIYSKRFEGN